MHKLILPLLIIMSVSAYTPKENGGNRITASGAECQEGVTVACNDYDFGTRLIINGHEYIVQDRMAENGCVDIFMESYAKAIEFGRQGLEVEVVE